METTQVQDLLERIAVSVEEEAENFLGMPRLRLTLDQLAAILYFLQKQWFHRAIDQLNHEIADHTRSNAWHCKFHR